MPKKTPDATPEVDLASIPFAAPVASPAAASATSASGGPVAPETKTALGSVLDDPEYEVAAAESLVTFGDLAEVAARTAGVRAVIEDGTLSDPRQIYLAMLDLIERQTRAIAFNLDEVAAEAADGGADAAGDLAEALAPMVDGLREGLTSAVMDPKVKKALVAKLDAMDELLDEHLDDEDDDEDDEAPEGKRH